MSFSEQTRRRLESAVSRMSHAYMISGRPEERAEAAEYLASAAVCTAAGDRPCGVCSGCRKAREKIHPDIIRVSLLDGKREIIVEQVRQLRADAYIRPNEAMRKVFIIDPAQAMNASAQNAMLKVLEDGPAYLSFLLLTDDVQQLLPTVRSRCETLALVEETQEAQLDPELSQKAGQLAALLLGQDERALMEFTVGLENSKMDRETLAAFLAAVQDALRPELLRRPKQVLPLVERLDEILRAAQFNVGAGHLLGWLTAAR